MTKSNKPVTAKKAGEVASKKTNEKVQKDVQKDIKKDVQNGGYKDPYSGKVYESKEAFVAMKTKGDKKTNFCLLYSHLLEVVNKGTKEATIDVEKLGPPTMDARLPRYILGFIPKGEDYRVNLDQKAWNKFTLIKK